MPSIVMTEKQKQKRKSIVQKNSVEEEQSEDELHLSDDDDANIIDGIRIPPATKPTCSFDPTGPRLIITKITNNFFKSYAEEQVLGPFHKCFNAIIGPNGSGKSNVIDSMLFVFGYRATKIRSKKVSVLLHNSDKYRNVQSCTVSVHFAQIIDKSGDDYDIVPGSEFVVSRTANKDNSSYYTLDGKKVQFKEVGKLLKSHGIDLDHNRFLILQGEVEQIAMMKCKADNEHESGMLEYLEDIIGTNRYKKPLTQVHERVEYLTEHRTEKLNRLNLVQREMEELKEPMEEAVGFLKTENKVVTSKNFLFQKNIYSFQKKLEKYDEEKKTILEEQQDYEENLKKLNEEKAEKEKILKKKASTYEHLRKRKEDLTEAFNKANNKDVQLQETMMQTNNTRKKTKELLIEEKKKLEKLQKVPEESEKGIEECEKKIEEVTVKKEKYEEEKTKLLSTLRTQTVALQEKKDVLQNELIGLKKSVDETKSSYVLAESELKIYVSSEENEKDKLENLIKEYETSQATIEERTKQIGLLKKKIPATEKSLNDASSELNVVKYQESQLISNIRSNRAQVEEKRSSMQASKSRGKVLDSLMAQKRDGNCPGLYGRLGDLGAIDQKYDVAISTACGPLDNIVVDNVGTAQWCIEFLKKYDLGRATFIALDKQEHLRQYTTSKIKTPENVHRLYDLIQVQDEDVRTAFYYALRDTLVADDLEQATRIAYGQQRFRVVTLKGDLIEMTGTMSGGGKQVSRGRMGQSVRVSNVNPREIQSLEEDLEQMEQKVRELRQKQVSLESQINTLQPELRQMKYDLEKFSMELKGLQQQQPILEKQIKEQKTKSKMTKANPAQVRKLTKVMEEKKELYDAAAERAGVIQSQVDKINAEIEEKTSGKMKLVDKNLNEAIKVIDKCKAEITRLMVAVTTSERNTKKSQQKIKTMEEDIVNMENRLRQMKTERTEIEEDAAKLLQCIKEITTQLAEGEESFADLKKEVANLVKQENKLKSEKVDIDQKLKTVNGKINECKSAIHQLEVKISHLKLQDIPNESTVDLEKYTHEELLEKDAKEVEKELEAAETHLRVAKPNLNAIEEYRNKQMVYIERSKELEEISMKRMEMRKLFDNLKSRRREEFIIGYNIIKLKLKEMYQMITLGGDADFELVDTYDPFSEGIQFNVRPPKKSWKKISNLSGGEKTLSSLALVFALHYYKPSPLYVMDEIDAALDFKNVSIVGNYIKQRTKNAQFIIISLRSNMFELCDNLVGIYKTFDCTKSITIDPRIHDHREVPSDKILVMSEDKQTTDVFNKEQEITDENGGNVENIPVEDSDMSEDGPSTSKEID
ncbi:structural maintenance of chromosomes protein 4 [Diorhabda sublineata]|uniref:structural maintenance of chromosomes protein 4 n=1 Tax=Diorhabda sublineata TaxID=1163346 RepID=UPI0024E1402F|nr:structural maintenance of chromosomes protein 4 [Diorhabda sublineata]